MKTKIFKWFGKDGPRDDSDRQRPNTSASEASRSHSGSSYPATTRSRGSGSNQVAPRNRTTTQQGRTSSHTSQRDRARDRRAREQFDYVTDSDTDSESQQILERNQEEAENMMLAIAIRSSVLDNPGRPSPYFSDFSLPSSELNPAEKQSCTYWSQGCLGYNDKIRDGFYDLFGDFPEVVDRDEFPSYKQLQGVTTVEGDLREVVYVHSNDPGLQRWENQAIDAIAAVANKGEVERIQAVATLVAEVLGGQALPHHQLYEKWKRATQKIKAANGSKAIVPIGKLRVGLSRHRAVLFKVLCERLLDVECQLLNWKMFAGTEDTAMNIVKMGGQEWAVDLVLKPGRLYSAGGNNLKQQWQQVQSTSNKADPIPVDSSTQQSENTTTPAGNAVTSDHVTTVSTATSPSPPSLLTGASISEWRASLASAQQPQKQASVTSPVKTAPVVNPITTSNNTYASLFANARVSSPADSSTSTHPVNPSRADSALEIPSPPRSPTHSTWNTMDAAKFQHPELMGPNGSDSHPNRPSLQDSHSAEMPTTSYTASHPAGASHTPSPAYRPASSSYTSNGTPSQPVGPHQVLPHHSPQPPDPAASLAGYANPLTLHASPSSTLPYPPPPTTTTSPTSPLGLTHSQQGHNRTAPHILHTSQQHPSVNPTASASSQGLVSSPITTHPPQGLGTNSSVSAQRVSTVGSSLTYHQLAETSSATDYTQPILLPESSASSAGTLAATNSTPLQHALALASQTNTNQYPPVDFYHAAPPLPPAGSIVLTNAAQPPDTASSLPYAAPIGNSPLATPFSHVSAQAALELASAVRPHPLPPSSTSSSMQSAFGVPSAVPLSVNSASAINDSGFYSNPQSQSANHDPHMGYPTTIPWSTYSLDSHYLGTSTSAPPHQHPAPTRVPSNSLDLPLSTSNAPPSPSSAHSKPMVSPFGVPPGLDAPAPNPSPFAAPIGLDAPPPGPSPFGVPPGLDHAPPNPSPFAIPPGLTAPPPNPSPFSVPTGLDAHPPNPSPFTAPPISSAASSFSASALSPTALPSPFIPGYSFLEGLSSVSAVPPSARLGSHNPTSTLMPTTEPIPAAPQSHHNGLNPHPMHPTHTAHPPSNPSSNPPNPNPHAHLQIHPTTSPVPSLSQISSADQNETIPPTLPSSSAGWTMVSNPGIISIPNTPSTDYQSQQTIPTPWSAAPSSMDVSSAAHAAGGFRSEQPREQARRQELTTEELLRREALLGVGSFLELDPAEIQLGSRIGIGSYGEVYKGTWGGTEVAVKKFLEQGITPEVMREFKAEVSIMNRLRHPNIVLFMGAVTKPHELAIVTQYVPRGSLFRILHRTKPELDNRKRLNMALDIARGMHYLHSSKPAIVHRDLKSPNLLVDRDWTIKVCDFGLSKTKAATFLTSKSHGGTPEWMAPEILRSENADERSDVYSYGVVLYELVTGLEPWQGKHSMAVVGMVGFANMRLPLPEDMEPSIALLIRRCWAHDPRERPSFGEILDILGKRDKAEGIPPCATVLGAPPPPLPSGGNC